MEKSLDDSIAERKQSEQEQSRRPPFKSSRGGGRGGYFAPRGRGSGRFNPIGENSRRTFQERGANGELKLCDNCLQPGHLARVCSFPPTCYICGGLDHNKSNCQLRDQSCTSCGLTGHKEARCRTAALKRYNTAQSKPHFVSGGGGGGNTLSKRLECFACGGNHLKVSLYYLKQYIILIK